MKESLIQSEHLVPFPFPSFTWTGGRNHSDSLSAVLFLLEHQHQSVNKRLHREQTQKAIAAFFFSSFLPKLPWGNLRCVQRHCFQFCSCKGSGSWGDLKALLCCNWGGTLYIFSKQTTSFSNSKIYCVCASLQL